MKRGRFTLLINREIQLRFVVYVIVFLTLAMILISVATFFNVWESIIQEVAASSELVTRIYHLSWKRFLPVSISLTVLMAALSCLGIIVLSHKVAGPAYRIAEILKDLQEGRQPDFRLRKGDTLNPLLEELKSFAQQQEAINQAASRVISSWHNVEIKDISLNLSLKELEDCLSRGKLPKEGQKP
ncbi:MAG: hypothetical protein NC911_04420 [Candidatus Omnitrophica bacterium]|nr:hypothetical protein [Candidatus Omnitrophota bacterium]